jgi:transposase-like protein
MENKISCPRCVKEEVWKAGRPRGEQQYQCKNCRRKFITELNYNEEFKREAIQIFYKQNNGRTVGRIK